MQSGTVPLSLAFTPGSGTATLAGTPNPGTGGIYNLVFAANNGFSSRARHARDVESKLHPHGERSARDHEREQHHVHGRKFGSFAVTANGFPAPSFSATGALPGGVT